MSSLGSIRAPQLAIAKCNSNKLTSHSSPHTSTDKFSSRTSGTTTEEAMELVMAVKVALDRDAVSAITTTKVAKATATVRVLAER